jgi:hypothetical protein
VHSAARWATPAADECPGAPQAERRYGRLFLTSSVSGGSVGIYQLIRHARVVGREPEWIERTNGREVLSPLLAWGLFHDLPAYLIGAPTDPARCADALSCPVDADRAAVQAAAIAGREGRADATSLAGGLLAQDGPVTVMNTAQVPRQDPGGLRPTRRVVLSRVSLGEPLSRSGCPGAASQPIPDTFDGHDLVGSGQDLTVATSAMLSARFPFLEPPDRIGSASHPPREACAGPPADRAAKIRDGGTFENSGLLTLTDVLPSIQEAIERWKRDNDGTADVRLVVVSIDDDVPGIKANDEHDTEGFEPHKPGERTDAARGKLGTCRFEGVTYMRISPVPHVGAQAATGWEVSQTSRREDLVESLLPTSTTGQQVERLRAMLDGTTPPPGCRR